MKTPKKAQITAIVLRTPCGVLSRASLQMTHDWVLARTIDTVYIGYCGLQSVMIHLTRGRHRTIVNPKQPFQQSEPSLIANSNESTTIRHSDVLHHFHTCQCRLAIPLTLGPGTSPSQHHDSCDKRRRAWLLIHRTFRWVPRHSFRATWSSSSRPVHIQRQWRPRMVRLRHLFYLVHQLSGW